MERHIPKIKCIFVFVIGIAILINIVQYHEVHWFEFKTWSTPHHRILAENTSSVEEEIMSSTKTEEETMKSTKTKEETMKSTKTEEETMKSTKTKEETMKSTKTKKETMNSIKTEEEIMNGTTTNDKVTNIAFLKVHKAGSTTMQNLLFRFGLRHKLNILLPTSGNYLYNMQKVIPLPPSQTYNIFAIHTSYSKSLFAKLIPDKEAVYIAIVREPIDRLISGAYYYRYVLNRKPLVDIPEKDFIHNLINHPELYNKELFSNTRNAMGADFGFGRLKNPLDKKVIELHLNNLNKSFLLVMIMERIDESLVMLKRRLSWSFLDIIYLKSNSNQHNKISLNATELEKVRNTNVIDFAIYEYFSTEFESQLKTMSGDFDAEVIHYRGILKQVSSFCARPNLQDESKVVINGSVWDSNFVVTGEECRWMHTDEVTFIQHLRQKYMPFSKP